jgi:hypothetical protein
MKSKAKLVYNEQPEPGAFVRRLSIVFMLVVAGVGACRRQVVVSSPPPGQQAPAVSGAPGGATAREAAEKFLGAARVGDLDAMSLVWGTSAGPVRSTMSRQEWEMREVVFMRCLRHDSWRIASESPAVGGERLMMVEIKWKDLTRSTSFYAVQAQDQRWYVRQFDMTTLETICQRPI